VHREQLADAFHRWILGNNLLHLANAGTVGPLASALGVTVAAITPAHAQTLTTLYRFTGSPDGQRPSDGVAMDSKGNIYGTTSEGGKGACPEGCGTAFKLSGKKESWVYSFVGSSKDGDGFGG
jgi:hypothetical protein